jgi:hypothetical protein
MASSHTGDEKNFMCPYCQKTFKTNVLCRKHMKIHRAEVKAGKVSMVPAEQQVNPAPVLSNLPASQPAFFAADSNGIFSIPIQPHTGIRANPVNPGSNSGSQVA